MKFLLKLFFFISLGFFSIAFAADKNKPAIYTKKKNHIVVTQAQPQFSIQLKSNPTTGFSWFLRDYNPQFIQPLSHHFEAGHDTPLIGAPGYEIWTFKVKTPAFTVPLQTPIHFIYARPWEKAKTSTEITFWIATVPGKTPKTI